MLFPLSATAYSTQVKRTGSVKAHVKTGRHMGVGTVTCASIPNWIVFHTQEHTHEHVHVQHALAFHWEPGRRNCSKVPSAPLISYCLTMHLSISILAQMSEDICACELTHVHKHTLTLTIPTKPLTQSLIRTLT